MDRRTATAAALVLVALAYPLGPGAEAASRRGGEDGVTSCSRYGNGCRTVAVRSGRNGLEYRSPGGSWIECRRDCREAVREDVIDFWETLREKSPAGSH